MLPIAFRKYLKLFHCVLSIHFYEQLTFMILNDAGFKFCHYSFKNYATSMLKWLEDHVNQDKAESY